MDSSDGLADALVQLCQAAALARKLIVTVFYPSCETRLISPALNWALYGEDFECCASSPDPAFESY